MNYSLNYFQSIVFLDDLNMPATDEFGAQPPIELLRTFLELGGFYTDLKWKVNFYSIKNQL